MKFSKIIAAALSLVALASTSKAINLSYTGNLSDGEDIDYINFTVTTESLVTFRTWSYAGGVNAAGTTIVRGGFDPILALFGNGNALLGQNDDGNVDSNGDPVNNVSFDPVTGQYYDAFFSELLGPGTYMLSVAQFANFALGPNLSDGFSGSGNVGFVDATGNQRSSAYAVDILGVDVPAVPDGGSTLLLLSLSTFGLMAFSKKARHF